MAIGAVCRGSSVVGECPSNDPNLKWGEDISDKLLTNDDVIRERGRVEIDKSYTNRKLIDLTLAQITFQQPGIIAISIVEGVEVNTGMLTDINIHYNMSGDKLSVGSAMKVERNV